MTTVSSRVLDGRSDFDFIFGRWWIRNRKLRDAADPACDEWVEFEAHSSAEPILDGLGHIDRMWVPAAPGVAPFEGFTLRQFDPGTGTWRIWWASSSRPGRLDPPVEGSWSGGRGLFSCTDVLAGQPVRIRFTWTCDTPVTARWSQAFSYDDGSTWRTNWTMDLTRRGDDPARRVT